MYIARYLPSADGTICNSNRLWNSVDEFINSYPKKKILERIVYEHNTELLYTTYGIKERCILTKYNVDKNCKYYVLGRPNNATRLQQVNRLNDLRFNKAWKRNNKLYLDGFPLLKNYYDVKNIHDQKIRRITSLSMEIRQIMNELNLQEKTKKKLLKTLWADNTVPLLHRFNHILLSIDSIRKYKSEGVIEC